MISAALAILKTDEERNELSDFYEKNKSRFYSIAFSKLHNRASAEDAVQEAFLRIADKPEKFFEIPHNKRVAFTDVIIRSISIDMFKKMDKNQTAPLTDTIASDFEELPLDDRVISSVSRAELVDFISNLPPLQRDILELKAVDGLSNSEISQHLSISENVVRQRLFQARKAIAQFIESGDISNE